MAHGNPNDFWVAQLGFQISVPQLATFVNFIYTHHHHLLQTNGRQP
jgi:hypothetical protein